MAPRGGVATRRRFDSGPARRHEPPDVAAAALDRLAPLDERHARAVRRELERREEPRGAAADDDDGRARTRRRGGRRRARGRQALAAALRLGQWGGGFDVDDVDLKGVLFFF